MSELNDFDAQMAEPDNGVETPEPAPEPTPASTESQAKIAALDALIPDSDDVDEKFRGKPVSEVTRLAKQWEHEAKVAAERNQKWNDMEFELRATRALLERQARATQAPQQPQQTPEQFLERFTQAPDRVLPEVIQQTVAPLAEQINEMRAQLIKTASDAARERARVESGFSAEAWEKIAPWQAAIMYARGWNSEDPRAWVATAEEFKRTQAVSAPKVDIPRPAAPPGGQARSVVKQPTAPRLSERKREQLGELAAVFGVKPGSKEFSDLEAEIAGGNL